MFNTFSTTSSTSPRPGARAESRTKADGAKPAKRSQVRRACDWCKLMRIKCDNHRPCHNCHQADRGCTISSENQFRSIAAAVKEVERLRAQIREFESRQEASKKRDEESPVSSESLSPVDLSRRDSLVKSYAPIERPSASHNGVRVASTLFGVASLPFFLTRMGQFLRATRPQLILQLDLDEDITNYAGGARYPPALHQDWFYLQNPHLSYSQEAHFLDLFWQTHYFSFPILNEGQFRRDFNALWAEGEPRKPSPLVDIVLALCIQLGSFSVRVPQRDGPDDAATCSSGSDHYSEIGCPPLAGFQYYRRCQAALDEMIESPTITTVQCYIFSIVYLFEAGLLNRAQVMVGKAIMMAVILGLPNEPHPSEPMSQKEVTRRTWWSLYILDAKLSMEVGRPPIIGPSHSSCKLPSDTLEVALSLGPHYKFDDTCPTWLGFQTQALHLLDAVRTLRSVFYAKYDAEVGENGYDDFVNNGAVREDCARLLGEQMRELDTWVQQVPQGYLVPRIEGRPYTTDRSPLDLSSDVIIHCQRQRLLLELQYHQYCMSLYQPFVCFSSCSDMSTPLSDSKAVACLNHAITLTSMISQALSSSESLTGVYHVFRWQRNALFTTLGFAYTFPVSHSTAVTRKYIEMAITSIETYRDIIPEASHVAATARILADDVEAVITEFGSGGNWSSSSSLASVAAIASSKAAASSDVHATVPSTVGLASNQAPNGHDLIMAGTMPDVTGQLLDLNFGLGEIGTNWEVDDSLWTSLTQVEDSNFVGSWGTSMGGIFPEGLTQTKSDDGSV